MRDGKEHGNDPFLHSYLTKDKFQNHASLCGGVWKLFKEALSGVYILGPQGSVKCLRI